MSFPLFRFTLSNTIEGTLEIKEPEGWDDGVLKLERNKEYHSLVEYWDQPLLFDDAEASDVVTEAVLPGGLEWIKNIEYTQGVGAIISIEIEISDDGGDTYQTIFLGTLALDTAKEVDFYKAEYGVLRDGFFARIINRKNTPVDLMSTTDLEGGTRMTPDEIELPMPSQKIRQNTDATASDAITGIYEHNFQGDTSTFYYQLSFDIQEPGEIPLFNLPQTVNDDIPVPLAYIEFAGTYSFDIRTFFTPDQSGTLVRPSNRVRVFLAINDTEYELTINNSTDIFFFASIYTLTLNNIELNVGDEIRLYGRNGNFGVISPIWGSPETWRWNYDGTNNAAYLNNYFRIVADTLFPATTTDAFLLPDAFESVLSKIACVDTVLESDYLYGCGGQYAIGKGLHIRGYSFAEKPLFLSLDDLWQGINPILNLGLGYVNDQDKIEILKKGDFYNKTTILNLDFVNNIERSYDLDTLFKTVEIGYEKWAAESAGGIDDPQSKRRYRTSFPLLGKDEKILSKFIAAAGAIEQTRRNRVELGKDWRLDDETLIISVVPGSPEWTPEFAENFGTITNLLNPEFRYNIRLSAARNLERWMNYISGGLQIPSGQDVIFASGEGNYDMTSQLNPDDCEASDATPEPVIDEKGNFDVTGDFLFMPILYTFEHPLTFEEYDLIRNNRKNAIGVSRGDSDHKACFIMSCSYKPTRAIAEFEVLLGVNDPL